MYRRKSPLQYLFSLCSMSVLVLEPAPGSAASGSMSDITWSHNRFGAYARSRTKPVNPSSARQQTIRGLLSTLTARWAQTLTTAQRTAWNLYASSVKMKNRIGQDVYLTGFNHYLRSNVVIGDIGGTYVDAGPTIFELPEKDATMAITVSEATQIAIATFDDAADWCGEDDAYLYFLQGTPQNPQRNFFNGPWRGSVNVAGDTATPITSPQNLAGIIQMTEGQKVWGQFRIVRADGRVSQPFQAQCLVGA